MNTISTNSNYRWRSHLMAARLAFKQGQYHAAGRNLHEAMDELSMSGHVPSNDESKEVLYMQSLVHEANGDYSRAEAALRKALSLVDANESYQGEHGVFLRRLAGIHRLGGRLEQAEQLYLQAIAELSESHDCVQVGKALLGLGQVLTAKGRTREARDYLQAALEIFSARPGKDSLVYARCLLSLGLATIGEDRTQALENIQQAVDAIEFHVAPEHPLRAFALKQLLTAARDDDSRLPTAQLVKQIDSIDKDWRTRDV